jgi:hypothetical protein
LSKHLQHCCGLPTANAVRLEDPLDRALAQPGCLCRCRRSTPQIEQPFGGKIIGAGEHLRVIAPQLLVHALGQTTALLPQILGHARPFAQFDDHRIVNRYGPKGVPVGAQAVASTRASRQSSPACVGAGFWRQRR